MEYMNQQMANQIYISSEVRFYGIEELKAMLGWGEETVQKLFNDPSFPYTNFGKRKVVEAHALIKYFSVRHIKETERYWNGKGKKNVKAKR